MNKKYFLIVILFNLFIAAAFYVDNAHNAITAISGDLANILPICKKLDNPKLFLKDEYLGDINNIKYYTPFYVETLRFFAKFTSYDYLKALNVLSFTTHFLYGTIWFYFFFLLKKDFWLAFGFSIFFRGILWPPGMELLGIADIWTIMPRTLFIALIPLPFIFFKLLDKNLFLPALILGLLVNFHPISGIGAIIVYLSIYSCYNFFNNQLFNKKIIDCYLKILFGIFIGMSPYFFIYFINVKPNVIINQQLFETAIYSRIDPIFFDGFLFLTNWQRPYTYFFGLFFIGLYFLDSSLNKSNFKMLFFSSLILLLFTNSLPALEKVINQYLDLHFRIAFQLIRCQKLIVILLQISMYLCLSEIIKKYNIQNNLKVGFIAIYLMFLSLSTAPIICKLPLIGDDISTYILPNNLKFYSKNQQTDLSILEVFKFINATTDLNALFYCKNYYFRAATSRAVVIDFHAAGMLVEGNPQAFINAYHDYAKFETSNFIQKLQLLKTKKVNYIIDNQKWDNLIPIIKIKEYYIYKI